MFSYFGSKYRLAKKYPKPRDGLVIEPFAGSACYSLYWDVKESWLYDLNPKVCGVWDYLIHASSKDILALPLDFEHLDELTVCQEAKWLIGFCLGFGSASPRNVMSPFAKRDRQKKCAGSWSEQQRQRVSEQVNQIRNWKIFNSSYTECPDVVATWFIDPPYAQQGKVYPHNEIDRDVLSAFCWSRLGLVMACDDDTADYLPFADFAETRGCSNRISKEAVWINDSGHW
jgi:site-specific DNA-adenine methylase